MEDLGLLQEGAASGREAERSQFGFIHGPAYDKCILPFLLVPISSCFLLAVACGPCGIKGPSLMKEDYEQGPTRAIS